MFSGPNNDGDYNTGLKMSSSAPRLYHTQQPGDPENRSSHKNYYDNLQPMRL